MRNLRWKIAYLSVVLIIAGGFSSAQTKAPSTGGFAAQAKRGHEGFVKSCANCHAPDLTGLDPAPPLTGEAFMKKWQGKSLWDLYDKIRKTMPQQNKGSLSPKTYLDIVAFLAKFNAVNAGK
ncbi:MAG TPA: cytochrome c, partial [Terriglobales bacterium]|nr:cytochrome c [Terriglobales bacterium]